MESFVTFESVGVSSSNTAAANKTALQAALDSYAGSGRITTFYGGNHYRLDGPISIPSDICIMGNSKGLKGSPHNSRFIVTDTVNNVFKMNDRTTIDGWIFDYPNQPLTTTTPSTSLIVYPSTIVQDDVFNEQLVIKNCCVVGASSFINLAGSTGNQDIHIENVYGYTMLGRMVAIERCFDIPYVNRVHVNPGAGKSYRTPAANGIPASNQVIDYAITNASAEATFLISSTDEFVLAQCFAFGVKTAFQFTNSYGSCVQCNADMVETGFLVQPNTDRKAVQLIGCSGIPSAGSTTANRNMIVFSGAGGSLIVQGLNIQLGTNSAVPSSSAAANAAIKVSGTGDQDIIVNGMICNSTGTFTYDIQKSNASAVVKTGTSEVKNATNKIIA